MSIPFQLEDIRQILEGILNGEGSIGTTVNQGNAGVQSWLTSDSVTQSRLSTVATLLSGTLNIEGTGTAGSPNANVLTIQGISGGTPLPISGSITATNPSVSATGAAFPTSATLLGIISGSNLVGVSASNPLPITGSISATNPSVSTIGSTSPTSATLIGGNDASGNLRAPGTTAASTAAVASQLALITAFSPNSPLPTGSNVIGSVSQNGAWSVSITGTPTVTANAGTGTFATSSAQLPAALDGSGYLKVHEQGTANVSVQNSSLTVVQSTAANLLATVSQGGSWTVTSNIGTTNGLALDTSVNGLLLSQGSTTTSQKGPLILSATTTGSPTYSSGTSNPLSSTTAGALRVDGSATTQPVSGSVSITGTPSVTISSGTVTVTQATGTNLHTVIDSGTVAATQSGAWTVSGTGTAGTPATGVITVQGNASGTPVPVSGTVTASNPSVSTTGSAPPGSATYVGGSVTTASPSYTTGQFSALSLTLAGALRVDGSGVTQPISGSVSITGTPAVTVSSGTVTVTQGTGSNLHTVVDSGSLIVTQATAANLNATITGTGTAGTPASGIITVQGNASGTPIPISGSISATNPSVGTIGSTTPTSATTIGGNDTSGNLRTPGTTAASTAAVATQLGLVVSLHPTSPLPAGFNALGSVSVTGTTTVSGTVTANAGTGTFTTQGTLTHNNAAPSTNNIGALTAIATAAAPTYTTGDLVALSTDLSGNLRIGGSITASNPSVSTTGSAPPSSATYIGGSVTTSAPSYTTGQMSALSLNTSGGLRVDGSGVTQPVSGTVSAAQSGTWTNTVTQATGTNLHTVVDSGSITVTQATAANLNATVTGTVTSNQGGAPWTVTGTGTAGSPAAGIVTIQGNASGTPIPISGSITATNPSVSTTGSAPPGSATYIGGSVTTSSPTYTTGQMSGLSLTTAGALRVDASDTTQPISGSVSITGTPSVTVSSGTVTVTQATGTNLHTVIDSGTVAISGTVAVTESGTWTVQPGNTANTTPWLSTINQGGNSAAVTASNALKIDGSAVTQPVSGSVSITGTPAVTVTSGAITVSQATGTNLHTVIDSGTVTLGAGSASVGTVILGAGSAAIGSLTANQSVNLTQINGTTALTGGTAGSLAIGGLGTAGTPSGGLLSTQTVDITASGTITTQNLVPAGTATAGSSVAISTNGQTTIGIGITGVYTGALSFQGSMDGTTWVTIAAPRLYNTGVGTSVGTILSAATGNFLFDGAGSFSSIRITALGVVTGTATIKMRAALGQSMATQVVATIDGNKATYSGAISGLAPAATATDIFTITGSATKTVRVTRIGISGTQTTASEANFILLKRQSADSGGTTTLVTAVPHDANDGAATAQVLGYTGNPFLGTLVGNIRTDSIFIPVPAATAIGQPFAWEFGLRPGAREVVLRGTSQALAVNLNSITLTGASLNISIEWTEE